MRKRAVIKMNDIQVEAKARVERKLRENIYRFEDTLCPICGGGTAKTIADSDRYGLEIHCVICKKCGVVRLNPHMTQDSYDDFYDSDYRALYSGVDAGINVDENFFIERIQNGAEILNYLKDHNIKFGSVLEIGCNAGTMLEPFRDKGYKVTGIDLGSEYIEIGIKRGLELYVSSAEDFYKETSRKFDVIILNHVLEHFVDINKELAAIKELMSDNGVLYICVPGLLETRQQYFDFRHSLQNAHIFYFSSISLRNLLQKNGFRIVDINEHIQALCSKNPDINHNIENCYMNTIVYLWLLAFYSSLYRVLFSIKSRLFPKLKIDIDKRKIWIQK